MTCVRIRTMCAFARAIPHYYLYTLPRLSQHICTTNCISLPRLIRQDVFFFCNIGMTGA